MGKNQEHHQAGRPTPPEPDQASVYLDYGPTLPDSYQQDTIFLMIRDPECIFTYWELSGRIAPDTFRLRDLKKYAVQWTLRTHNLSHKEFFDTELETPANPDNVEGRYYLAVRPDNEYQVEIGLLSNQQFISLVKSNIVRTPLKGKSGASAESSFS
jgi:hypothetical protein